MAAPTRGATASSASRPPRTATCGRSSSTPRSGTLPISACAPPTSTRERGGATKNGYWITKPERGRSRIDTRMLADAAPFVRIIPDRKLMFRFMEGVQMFYRLARGLTPVGFALALLATPFMASAQVFPNPTPVLPPGVFMTTQDAAIGAAPGKAITFPVPVMNNTAKPDRIKPNIHDA